MKHFVYLNKIILFLVLAFVQQINAQQINWKTRSTQISIDNEGYFASVLVEGKDILHKGKYPLITACVDNLLVAPKEINFSGELVKVKM